MQIQVVVQKTTRATVTKKLKVLQEKSIIINNVAYISLSRFVAFDFYAAEQKEVNI